MASDQLGLTDITKVNNNLQLCGCAGIWL